MKLFGWVVKTRQQHAAELQAAEDRALSRLIVLLSKKDKIYLAPVTLGSGPHLIIDNVFLGASACVVVEPQQEVEAQPPSDRNARIALAKGWRRVSYDDERIKDAQGNFLYFYWGSSSGIMQAELPDWAGTLQGIAELLRELQENQYRKEKALRRIPDILLRWSWRYVPQEREYACEFRNQSGYRHTSFTSPVDHPGDCVVDAYLSVFEKVSKD